MNITDLADVSYTPYIVVGVILLIVLLIGTNLGLLRDIHALKDAPQSKRYFKYFNKPAKLSALWVSLFVIASAACGGLMYLSISQDVTKMNQKEVEAWMNMDYAIEDLEFSNDKDTQVADTDGIPEADEIITGVMDGQRVSFYVHVGSDDIVYPMLLDKEIPKPYDNSKDD